MDRLTAYDIGILLNNVIGGTTAVGDSAIDYKVEKNLDILIDVANDIIDKLYESSRTAGSPYGSMNTIGLKAQKALQNICETYIEEC